MKHESDTVVLIHGLWMTARSWERWADRYSAQGYNVIAEGWPGLDVDVEELRRDPAPIAAQRIDGIVDHYARIIGGLDRPPIVMGHSFGGAFTQVLLDRGLAAAGVAISSAAVKGIFKLPWSTLRTGWPILQSDQPEPGRVDQPETSSTTASPTTSPRPGRNRTTTATACPAPATSSSKARWRTSAVEQRPR